MWFLFKFTRLCVIVTDSISLCSDALLQVRAAFPGSLPVAGGDICCCIAKQIQKQKGRPLRMTSLSPFGQIRHLQAFNPYAVFVFL